MPPRCRSRWTPRSSGAAKPNAVALPGGRIYVFEGLIGKSESADEVAGIIAHEIGHVAHRDGMRSLLQSAGLSFMFGMLLGDFVGGSAVVIGARAVLQFVLYARGRIRRRPLCGRTDEQGRGRPARARRGAQPHRRRDPSGHGDFARSPGYASARKADKRSRGGVCAATILAGAVRMGRAEAYLHGPMRRAYFARRIKADPTSRLAIWALRIAVFSIAVVLLGIVIVRSGILEIIPSLAAFGGGAAARRHRDRVRARRVRGDLARGTVRFRHGARCVLHRRRDPRLSGLSRRQSLSPARDLRHHHRPDRSAALRGGGAAAPARGQSDPLCRPARRRIAEGGLSERRAADRVRDAAGGLRRRHAGHHQIQVAHRRCARAARGPPRRAHRGGRAHADPRLPRRRRAAHSPGSRRRACRYPLDLALWPPRLRHQRGARRLAVLGDRRRGGRGDARQAAREPVKKGKKGDAKAVKSAPADKRR